MNYQALEGLIQSIVSQYMCEDCKSKSLKKDIYIKAIEGTSVLIEIECHKCDTKALIKSEVVSLDLTKYLTKEQLLEVKNSIDGVKNKNTIKDEQIVELNRNLKKENLEVGDLFK